MAFDVDDQVVGADGFLPTLQDFIPVHPDSPCEFLALTLKKYSPPSSSPEIIAVVPFSIVFVETPSWLVLK